MNNTDRKGQMIQANLMRLVDALRKRKWTLATAESCTGGLVASEITKLAGVSDIFQGSVVSYSNQVKQNVLNVRSDDLRLQGAVSESVVRQMALGAQKVLGSNVSIAITGIAGPTGGTFAKPVGTVWFAVSGPSFEEVEKKFFKGDREEIQKQSAEFAIEFLLRNLR